MEKDFHYHLIYSIVKMTEFHDAEIIAYASQFVDDNNEGFFSIDGTKTSFPEKIEAGGGHYYPIMTQSLSPRSLDTYVQKYVYVPFHFLPGDNNIEINGKKNKLSTTPNSQNAKTLMGSALNSDNPYRLGIALHTYADTWSHQNFTGLQEAWNSVYPWYNVFKSVAPNIGHAEAGHLPDVISDTWTDHRLNKKINNQNRAFEATGEIYKALRGKSRSGPLWSEVKRDYRTIIKAPGYDKRIERINNFLLDNNMGSVPKYSENTWIDEALDKTDEKIVMRPGFETTHWYRFHQAAKAQFAQVLDLTKEL
ncbi:MAG: DUF6765 family protein [Thermodesulfobacteriota bacterium]|nr:DUF6765 family protein [Thermodesulfobacteriota bacterium]